MNRSWIRLFQAWLFLACVGGLFGCDSSWDATLTLSDNRQFSITFPGDWQSHSGLNQKAHLQVVSKEKNLYLIVISEAKKDYPGVTLEDHSLITREILRGNLKKDIQGKEISRTIQGFPAIECELSGEMNQKYFAYLHTTVETQDHFHQILATSLSEGKSQYFSELKNITATFKKISLEK